MKKKNKGVNNLEKKMTADDIVTDKVDTSIGPRDKHNRTLK
ncbi:hypothetical protein [Ammoniphilus sp. YIM 78166]|nr:hypothetical protein [Ammoniphilus sp. YIM 78166]